MNARRTAIWTGVLFIFATVTSVAALVLSAPMTEAPDMASAILAVPNTFVASVLLIFASALSIVMIPVVVYPVLRRYSEAGALCYFAIRSIEGLVYFFAGILTLALLWVARIEPLADVAGHMRVLKAMADVGYATGTALVFGISAVVFGWLLWRSRLVPEWLSIWKVVGGLMIIAQGVITLFGPISSSLEMVLFMPIAVNEMVLALWLIFAGFRQDALAALQLN